EEGIGRDRGQYRAGRRAGRHSPGGLLSRLAGVAEKPGKAHRARDQSIARKGTSMCRSIKTLFNFEPPASDEEIRAASLQFVRKLSGFTKPSRANEAAFEQAVDDVAAIAHSLLHQ